MSDDGFWSGGGGDSWQSESDAYHEYTTVTGDHGSWPNRSRKPKPLMQTFWFPALMAVIIGLLCNGIAHLIDWLYYLFA